MILSDCSLGTYALMMVVMLRYMDGAVESGMRAAGEVLRNIVP